MRLGIIGGSGFYALGPSKLEAVAIDTPFGPVTTYRGELGGREIVFLPRHGRDHQTPPHLINYRANIVALKTWECQRIIAANAVGAIDESLKPGTMALPHQFLDFTSARARTLYEPPEHKPVHTDMTEPYCPELRQALRQAAEEIGFSPLPDVVYVCAEGPRFETAAEIRMFDQWGGEVVGMTGVPEVVFAREAGLCYASVCVVTNFAAGISPQPIRAAEVNELMAEKLDDLILLIEKAASRLPDERTCGCGGTA